MSALILRFRRQGRRAHPRRAPRVLRRAAVKVQANMWPVRPRPFVARPSRFFVRDRYRERRPSSRSRAFAGEPLNAAFASFPTSAGARHLPRRPRRGHGVSPRERRHPVHGEGCRVRGDSRPLGHARPSPASSRRSRPPASPGRRLETRLRTPSVVPRELHLPGAPASLAPEGIRPSRPSGPSSFEVVLIRGPRRGVPRRLVGFSRTASPSQRCTPAAASTLQLSRRRATSRRSSCRSSSTAASPWARSWAASRSRRTPASGPWPTSPRTSPTPATSSSGPRRASSPSERTSRDAPRASATRRMKSRGII